MSTDKKWKYFIERCEPILKRRQHIKNDLLKETGTIYLS